MWTCFASKLYTALATVQTFGLHVLFYQHLALKDSQFKDVPSIELHETSANPHRVHGVNDTTLDAEPEILERWERVMSCLIKAWTVTCTACILLLPFPLSFFQITGINGNIYARTAVLAMLVCCGIGLMTAGLWTQMQSKFRSKGFINQWLKACKNPKSLDAVDFWTCLCLPVSLLAWSMLFCITTLLAIAIDLNGNSDADFNDARNKAWHISSVVFLVTLTVCQVLQVYRFGKRVLAVSKC